MKTLQGQLFKNQLGFVKSKWVILRWTICLIGVLFFTTTVIAQAPVLPVNLPSPNAASIVNYGNVDVNLYRGVVTPQVPIVSFNERNIPLDISLIYNGEGVKPVNQPSWVGQNWSLSCGGSIVRTVKGRVDEYLNGYNGVFESYAGGTKKKYLGKNYFKCCTEPTLKHDEQFLLIDKAIRNYLMKKEVYQLGDNNDTLARDFQPDIFSFNFLGFSGKFFMGNDGNWKVSCNKNIKVVFDYADKSNFAAPPFREFWPSDNQWPYDWTICGFKLIDDQGNQYIFGYNSNAIEYDINYTNQDKEDWIASSWYLTKVIDKYGVEAYKFDYQRGYFIANIYSVSYLSDSKGTFNKTLLFNSGCSSYEYSFNKCLGRLISPVYLTNISSSSRKLLQFIVKDLPGQVADIDENEYDLRFNKDQDYFACETYFYSNSFYYCNNPSNDYLLYRYSSNNNNNTNSLTALKWARLDSIYIPEQYIYYNFVYDDNNSTNKRLCLSKIDKYTDVNSRKSLLQTMYSFEYDRFKDIPTYLSNMIDHWGFANGKQCIVDKNELANFSAYKEPDFNYTMIGSLSKIKYPTGGYTIFEYEPQRYSNYVKNTNNGQQIIPEEGVGGGLRIKSILNFDGVKSSFKKYDYCNSGILFMKPCYYWPNWTVKGKYNTNYTLNFFQVTPIAQVVDETGGIIGYSKVKEIQEDGSYSESVFSNYNTVKDELPATLETNVSPYTTLNSNGLMRGVLTRQQHYNNYGNLVKTIDYSYSKNQSGDFIYSSSTNLQPTCMNLYYVGSLNKLYYYDYNLTEAIETDYFANGTVQKKTLNGYRNLDIPNAGGTQLLKTTTNITLKDTTVHTTIYPSDIPDDRWVDFYGVGQVIGMKKTVNRKPTGYTGFKYTTVNGKLVPYLKEESETDELKARTKFTIERFDNLFNPQQVTLQDGKVQTYVWDFGYPLIKIDNVKYDDFAILLNKSAVKLSDFTLNSPTLMSSYAKTRELFTAKYPTNPISFYNYRIGVGMSVSIDERGKQKTYSYDESNRLTSVIDNEGKIAANYIYNYNHTCCDLNSISEMNFTQSGGQKSFEIQTDLSYTVTTDTPWIVILLPKTGSGNSTINIVCSENNGDSRSGKILIKNSADQRCVLKEITVNQSGGSNLEAYPNYINFGVDGGTELVSVGGSNSWYVAGVDGGFLSTENGNGGYELLISCSQNQSGEQRSGSVTLSNGSKTVTITISQTGN